MLKEQLARSIRRKQSDIIFANVSRVVDEANKDLDALRELDGYESGNRRVAVSRKEDWLILDIVTGGVPILFCGVRASILDDGRPGYEYCIYKAAYYRQHFAIPSLDAAADEARKMTGRVIDDLSDHFAKITG